MPRLHRKQSTKNNAQRLAAGSTAKDPNSVDRPPRSGQKPPQNPTPRPRNPNAGGAASQPAGGGVNPSAGVNRAAMIAAREQDPNQSAAAAAGRNPDDWLAANMGKRFGGNIGKAKELAMRNPQGMIAQRMAKAGFDPAGEPVHAMPATIQGPAGPRGAGQTRPGFDPSLAPRMGGDPMGGGGGAQPTPDAPGNPWGPGAEAGKADMVDARMGMGGPRGPRGMPAPPMDPGMSVEGPGGPGGPGGGTPPWMQGMIQGGSGPIFAGGGGMGQEPDQDDGMPVRPDPRPRGPGGPMPVRPDPRPMGPGAVTPKGPALMGPVGGVPRPGLPPKRPGGGMGRPMPVNQAY